jgi:signal transduction histidine kinase/HPt (histidine-containing phosphotransfer) domain-containing protein/FixJ family two-component response regulator
VVVERVAKLHNIKSPPLIGKFIIFSVILFLLVLIAGSMAFLFSHRQINIRNVHEELSQLLKIEQIKLEALVNSEIAIVLKMAGSPLIQQYFLNPSNSELQKIALEEIAAYRQAFVSNSIFWINEQDKEFYFDAGDHYTLDTEDSVNYWYKMTLYETEKFNFNINYNSEMKRIMLWINAPVFDAGHTPVGMVGTGINLSGFVAAIYQNYTGNATLYFFNNLGEITGSKDVDLINEKVPLDKVLGDVGANIFAMAKSLKSDETQTFTSPAGEVALRAVSAINWYVMAVQPITIDDYKTSITVLFLVVIVVIAAIFVIFNIFIARLIKPFRKTMVNLEKMVEQNKKHIEEITELAQKSKLASKAKGDFLARMSHEIRTPMNAIIGMSELALRKDMPGAVREDVIVIKQAGVNLLSIINDILDFSKIESGKLEIVPVSYLFSSLVNDVVSIIRMRAIDSRLRFVVNLDGSIPNALYGDETRIRQVLLNILSNAVKYTKEGFVSFSASGEIIDDTVHLTIDVTDSGIGIRPEDMEKLFSDFVQLDLSENKGIEGTGLGLAITKNLVVAMGGSISVASEYAKGSTFTITFPQKALSPIQMAKVNNPEDKSVLVYEPLQIYADSMICAIDTLGVYCAYATDDAEFREKLRARDYSFVFVECVLLENVRRIMVEVGSKAQVVLIASFGDAVAGKNYRVLAMPVHSLSVADILNGVSERFSYGAGEAAATFIAPSAHILVVDDINTNLKICEGLLLPYKMHVDLCLSGAEAIELVEKNEYDIVFMDHMMPGMDGVEAVRRIRLRGAKDERYLSIPIVALTANAVSGVKEMFLSCGFSDFLSKPIDTAKLNIILEKWLPDLKREKVSAETKAAEAPEAEMQIDGIDTKKGIFMTGGTLENYVQALAAFRRDGLAKIGEIKVILGTGSYHLYTTCVHALKSASASIGADALSEQAAALEAAGRQQDTSFIGLRNPEFLASLEMLLEHIGAALDGIKEHTGAVVDFDAFESEFCKLKAALDAYDFGAINEIAGGLREYAQLPEIGAAVENILQDIVVGRYEEASTAINALLKKRG